MKKAIGYCRVSTKEQNADDKFGMVAQKQAIKEYAKRNGYEIVAWNEDVGSGVSDERPEWNKICFGDDVVNPPFEAVIVFKSDRVARETKLYFYYLFLLEKKGVKLISVNEDFGEDKDFANIYRSIILFCAEQERKNIALRTSHGRRIKAVAGGYAGGRCPYGYRVVDGRLEPKEGEAEVIKLIFDMLDDNVSQGDIINYLNTNGFKTKTGTSWNYAKIFYIIKNRKLYEGYIKYGKGSTYVKGVHTPII